MFHTVRCHRDAASFSAYVVYDVLYLSWGWVLPLHCVECSQCLVGAAPLTDGWVTLGKRRVCACWRLRGHEWHECPWESERRLWYGAAQRGAARWEGCPHQSSPSVRAQAAAYCGMRHSTRCQSWSPCLTLTAKRVEEETEKKKKKRYGVVSGGRVFFSLRQDFCSFYFQLSKITLPDKTRPHSILYKDHQDLCIQLGRTWTQRKWTGVEDRLDAYDMCNDKYDYSWGKKWREIQANNTKFHRSFG